MRSVPKCLKIAILLFCCRQLWKKYINDTGPLNVSIKMVFSFSAIICSLGKFSVPAISHKLTLLNSSLFCLALHSRKNFKSRWKKGVNLFTQNYLKYIHNNCTQKRVPFFWHITPRALGNRIKCKTVVQPNLAHSIGGKFTFPIRTSDGISNPNQQILFLSFCKQQFFD